MATKAELETQVASLERKLAKAQKKAEEAAEPAPEPAAPPEPTLDEQLDDLEAAVGAVLADTEQPLLSHYNNLLNVITGVRQTQETAAGRVRPEGE